MEYIYDSFNLKFYYVDVGSLAVLLMQVQYKSFNPLIALNISQIHEVTSLF